MLPETSPIAPTAAAPAPWYAIRTRSNHEQVAALHLQRKGLSAYLPMIGTQQRLKVRQIPLFSGYFFARSDLSHRERIEILKAPGVMNILSGGGAPVQVPEWQVRSIQTILESRNPYEVLYRLTPGRRVIINTGALRGVEGVVMSESSQRMKVAVSVELFARTLVTEVDCAALLPLH